MFKRFNPNPEHARVGDCAVRAICKALDMDWDEAYIKLCLYGLILRDIPPSNVVWGRMLQASGFKRGFDPKNTRLCSVSDFSEHHNKGVYVLALSGHVVTVVDGNYYDTWDSGEEIVLYYLERKT